MIWSNLEFPSFNFNGIFDGFCILKGMSYMMPLSRHVLSLQTRLHRQFILGTVIPPTLAFKRPGCPSSYKSSIGMLVMMG